MHLRHFVSVRGAMLGYVTTSAPFDGWTEEQVSAVLGTQRRVHSALRQERRLQRQWQKYRRLYKSYVAALGPEFDEPSDLTIDTEQLTDEIYYLLLISHQALVAGPKLVRDLGVGVELPEFATKIHVEALRNVYEHWDTSHGTILDADHERHWSGKRNSSGRFLARTFPETLPNSFGGTDVVLDRIAGLLDPDWLRLDLQALDEVLTNFLSEHFANDAR